MKEKMPEDILVKRLAEAIQRALRNSKIVRKAIEAIEKQGHECMLSFSAAVILNDDESDTEFGDCSGICHEEDVEFEDYGDENCEDLLEFDEDDIKFLKSIKIKFP